MNVGRILDRLQKAEMAESNIWFRQDYRQAFVCVSLAARGEPEPFINSSYVLFGTHPDRVWAKIQANRHYRLGKEYGQWYSDDGVLPPDIGVPKKPAFNEQAERFCNERLAAVLMFPKILEVPSANVEQAAENERTSKERTGTLYTMSKPATSPQHQALRILPA